MAGAADWQGHLDVRVTGRAPILFKIRKRDFLNGLSRLTRTRDLAARPLHLVTGGLGPYLAPGGTLLGQEGPCGPRGDRGRTRTSQPGPGEPGGRPVNISCGHLDCAPAGLCYGPVCADHPGQGREQGKGAALFGYYTPRTAQVRPGRPQFLRVTREARSSARLRTRPRNGPDEQYPSTCSWSDVGVCCPNRLPGFYRYADTPQERQRGRARAWVHIFGQSGRGQFRQAPGRGGRVHRLWTGAPPRRRAGRRRDTASFEGISMGRRTLKRGPHDAAGMLLERDRGAGARTAVTETRWATGRRTGAHEAAGESKAAEVAQAGAGGMLHGDRVARRFTDVAGAGDRLDALHVAGSIKALCGRRPTPSSRSAGVRLRRGRSTPCRMMEMFEPRESRPAHGPGTLQKRWDRRTSCHGGPPAAGPARRCRGRGGGGGWGLRHPPPAAVKTSPARIRDVPEQGQRLHQIVPQP